MCTKTCYGFIIAVLLLGSCAPYYQMPQVQNTPMFTGKNQARLAISPWLSEKSHFIRPSYQGAYAIGRHVGIAASFQHDGINTLNNEDDLLIMPQKWSYKQYDLGVGYFTPLKSDMVFEIYAGIGGAHVSNKQPDYDPDLMYQYIGHYRVNFRQIYIQPAIASIGAKTDIIFSTRFLQRNFTGLTNSFQDEYIVRDLAKLDRRSRWFIEPAFNLRFGKWNEGRLVMQAQALISIPLQQERITRGNQVFSLGIQYHLNRIGKGSAVNN